MSATFELRNLALDYKFGELSLFKAGLPVWTSNIHFTRASETALAHPYHQGLLADVHGTPPADGAGRAAGLYFPSFPSKERLPRLSLRDGRICYVPYQYRRFVTDLTGSFAGYEAKFSGKTRATLKKKVRKFTELSGGQIRWTVSRTPAELVEFHRLAREVSSKTYQEKLLDCGIPESEAFRAEMRAQAERDQARGYLLFLGDKPVAYVYCPVQDGVVVYQNVGYDPAYREHSPGTVLQILLLESLFAEGRFRLFDYTEGEGAHKELFSTGSIPCADLYFFDLNARNGLLIGLQYALMTISSTLVGALKRLGIDRRIKKLLRFGRGG